MVEIKIKKGESMDKALRRFSKACQGAGVIAELKRRQYYEKPSTQRHNNYYYRKKRKRQLKSSPAKPSGGQPS